MLPKVSLQTSPEHPAPVRQIAQAISGWIDRLGAVWVEGQLTEIKRTSSNTVFMTLRDKLADVSLNLTCPRAVVDSLSTPLVDGSQIVVQAKPLMYANRGSFSLSVREIRLVGKGELLARLERRRQVLAAEGMFADSLKRRLPFLPQRIGLVTGQRSAAERDVVENTRQRWPGVDFAIHYAVMQGPRCVEEVMASCQSLDNDPDVDIIVIARGGGSLEDLLPFSDEALIRCIHGLSTPVVSAIGHEQDSPLLDLVADLRASTPTDAARRIVPEVSEQISLINHGRERLRFALDRQVSQETQQLTALRQRLDLHDPQRDLVQRLNEITLLRERSNRTLGQHVNHGAAELAQHLGHLRALSPLATLRRGYAILTDVEGSAFSSIRTITAGDTLHVRVADGRVTATTVSVNPMPVEDR